MSNKHRGHVERNYRRLINALCMVIHYNMEDDFIDNFVVQLKVYEKHFRPIITSPTEYNPLVWVLWQLIVCMYGDFGVSPRAGWITDVAGAIAFLEELKGEKNNVE